MPAASSPHAPAGLPAQVQQLYAGHHQWLLGWLSRKLGCTFHAADLAHDTFVRLLSSERAVAIDEPRAFLTTVAKRLLLNHYRREQIERAYLDTLAALPEALAPSPEERAMVLEALCAIDRLLDGLPAPVRQAFLYAQLEGMPQADIAQRLDVSQTTVKRYLVRAMTQCYFAGAAN
ncbi:sigma-70 family RNA polymerase sigma factor [Pseudoduganella albidiflava]|uniref:RNA polymerase sigma factor n=1 Tax=Pseudoduganella albidiflava TaxID=321983 RepID=A0A411WS90_9BURK|nr:sigma-70 family RNA polymerase sigma factor [Pseudoduganella albidiflava]QBH99650.1 sigma-70 family RNA polymerase sigma factor [Pseudoduganella albidiflava]GGY46560.1 RNA polymerase sigma factor [Pseudoduganella albidiflava]